MRAHFATVRMIVLASDKLQSAIARMFPKEGRAPRAPVVDILPARLSASEQWQRVAQVLFDAQSRTRHAIACQRGASAQLDAATYALQRLREEISPALMFSKARPAPAAPAPTPFRRDQFRRRQPLAA